MTTLTIAPAITHNPYWDDVRDSVQDDPSPYYGDGPSIGGLGNYAPFMRRFDLVGQYSWTVTDPATVEFVARHLGDGAFDPMAGTGYWAYLLRQLGLYVYCSDLKPPAFGSGNQYHRGEHTWVEVRHADAVQACRQWGFGRTLLLSWPVYSEPIGAQVVAEHTGDRIVYIGEGDGGCCGDTDMWELLNTRWTVVAEHRPVQWYGLHDYVTVYDRIKPLAIGGAS